jgi:CMP-N,N'-diacetyllegionaminic acid synthase
MPESAKRRHLAIVPARGGSKAIPSKNIKPLGGKPLIQWAAEAARESGLFDKIVLSTDSPEIAKVGRSVGLEVPFLRPADIATDASPMLPVIRHALAHYEKEGYVPDVVILLQPTSPFRKPQTLREASRRIVGEGFDSVVGVRRVPDEYSPYYLMKVDEDGLLRFLFPEAALKTGRRQDALPAYKRCGSVFAFSRDCLEKHGNIYGERCFPLVADEREGVNIDTPEDWALAESFLEPESRHGR